MKKVILLLHYLVGVLVRRRGAFVCLCRQTATHFGVERNEWSSRVLSCCRLVNEHISASYKGKFLTFVHHFPQNSNSWACITNATHWQLLRTVCVRVSAGFYMAYLTLMQYKMKLYEELTFLERGQRCWTLHMRLCDRTWWVSESWLERNL